MAIPSKNLASNEIELTPGQDLAHNEKDVVRSYMDLFGQKEFMRCEAQGIPSFATQNT